MRRFYIITASTLLLFNGIGALYGGWNLISHPDGSSIQLSLDWLKNAPFKDYFIPGIVLFVANGLLSLFVFLLILLRNKYYPLMIIAQGSILLGWIVIQILMVQTVYFLHIVMGTTGILLLLIGWLIHYRKVQQTTN